MKFCRDFQYPDPCPHSLEDLWRERLSGKKYALPGSHIAGFTDHVVLKNGGLALISDEVGISDVPSFARKLKKANLTQHARRLVTLTMTQDMGRSLTALHDAGVNHDNMNSTHQVVDKHGHTNLIGLASVSRGPTVKITSSDEGGRIFPKNSPEEEMMASDYSRDHKTVKKEAKERRNKVLSELAQLFADAGRPGAYKKWLDDIVSNAADNEVNRRFAFDGKKADVFGVGVAAFELAMGRPDRKYRRDRAEEKTSFWSPSAKKIVQDRKIELARLENSHGVNHKPNDQEDPHDNEAFVDQTGDPVLDLLLDDLLAPNAGKRIAAKDIATHVSMQYVGIGSELVHKLIATIPGGDKAEIENAQAALLRAFPEPDSLKQYEDLFAERAQAHERLEKRVKDRVDKPQVFERV